MPYFDDEFTLGMERAARDSEGNYYTVPADITYPEWKNKFVNNSSAAKESNSKNKLNKSSGDDNIKTNKYELQEKIGDVDSQIDDLKAQFNEATEGYSYDEWFKDFTSIEDGYGDEVDDISKKLNDIDTKIKSLSEQKKELLLQKPKRGQLDTGYKGDIPYEELENFNKKGLEQIKIDTGLPDKEAVELQEALKKYFGGNYDEIIKAKTNDLADVISKGIDKMPVYDGKIYRGIYLSERTDVSIMDFINLKPGDSIPAKGIISSWSNKEVVAKSYAEVGQTQSSSVILECENNTLGAGVQHLSKFGNYEAEVLSNARYEVVDISYESKYDYLLKNPKDVMHKDNLIDDELSLRNEVVCRIKVVEKN